MVVCKFFQQGSCRFGQNCRFEHQYGSKYSYHAPAQSQNDPQPQASTVVTDEQLVHQVHSDVTAALKGNQWVLSSYAPFKEKPTLPGISDLSPEEARFIIYEAQAKNNLEEAIAFMNGLTKETRLRYEQLLQPSPTIIKTLRSLYKGEVAPSPFIDSSLNSAFGSSNNASSVFRSAVQTPSVFGQPALNNAASIFAQKSNSVFGTPTADAAKSIFSQATQNTFGSPPSNNVFGLSPENTAAKSIFAQAAQTSQAFPQQTNPSSIFASASQQFFSPSDPFGQTHNTSPFQTAPTSIFQIQDKVPANPFGAQQGNVFEQMADEGSTLVYSQMEQLTEEELEAFKSDSFRLGFIPEIPPPRELCV